MKNSIAILGLVLLSLHADAAGKVSKFLTCSLGGRMFTTPLNAGDSMVTTGDQTITVDDEELIHFSGSQLASPKYPNAYKFINFYVVCSSKTPDSFSTACTSDKAGKKWMSVGPQDPAAVTNDIDHLEFQLGGIKLECQLD